MCDRCIVRLFVMAILGASCGARDLQRCQSGSSLTPWEHVQRCAPLIKASACKQHLLDLDGGLVRPWDLASACKREYCPRFERPIPYCAGEYGYPANRYAPERDFIEAMFEPDYGTAAPAMRGAFFEAVDRLNAEHLARRDEEDRQALRETRLVVHVQSDAGMLSLSVVRPAGIDPLLAAEDGLTVEACRTVMLRALDGGSLSTDDTVLIRADKHVKFRVMKSLKAAALELGASEESVSFSTLR